MIQSVRHKELKVLWDAHQTGGKPSRSKVDAQMHARILRRLQALQASAAPEDMDLPGFGFHALGGFKPTRYAVSVNGPWRITFAFESGNAVDVDFEQYH